MASFFCMTGQSTGHVQVKMAFSTYGSFLIYIFLRIISAIALNYAYGIQSVNALVTMIFVC